MRAGDKLSGVSMKFLGSIPIVGHLGLWGAGPRQGWSPTVLRSYPFGYNKWVSGSEGENFRTPLDILQARLYRLPKIIFIGFTVKAPELARQV